jgi:hypothetical protein
MKSVVSTAVALFTLSLTSVAFADGKCGNGGGHRLFQFSKDELAVPWAIPIPQNAKVKFTTGATLDFASRVIGTDIPPGFPEKYTKGLKQVEVFNPTMAWSVAQLLETERRYGIEMSQEATAVFESYGKTGHNFVVALVEHPALSASSNPSAHCSVVLQRGLIEYADGRETLHLRSHFYSSDDAGGSANFVPRGAVEISFETPQIWFPLSLTKLIGEPASYVVLDIVTANPLKASDLGHGFRAETVGKSISLAGKTGYASRGTARLEAGKDLRDFRLWP